MFELVIILTRYSFLFYILYFIMQSVLFILEERNLISSASGVSFYVSAVSKQRVSIVFMHLTAFLILSYLPTTFSFDARILAVGAVSLVLLLLAFFLADKVYGESCHLMWNSVFFLFDVGFIMLQRLDSSLAERQLVWFFFGFAIMLMIPLVLRFIPNFERLEKVYLIIGLILVILPSFWGERIFGATNWVVIGNFNFQPSEVAKFLFVFYLASVFRNKLHLKQLIFSASMSAIFVITLVSQRDLGGALIFFMTYVVMLYIATSSELMFLSAIGSMGTASYIFYQFYPHVRVRVHAWQNPWADISSGGYQITQSLFAIGTWGFLGSGLTRGHPNQIPVAYSDFIFSAICEEFGSIFGIALILIYVLILYRGIHFSLRTDNRFFSLLASGFTAMLAFQTFLIIGGTIKLIPLTGVTMPFVSYGGSSVLASIMMIGILQWIHKQDGYTNYSMD